MATRLRALALSLCMLCVQCGASLAPARSSAGPAGKMRPAALIVPPRGESPRPFETTALTDAQIAAVLGAIVESEIAQAHLAEGKAASDGVADLAQSITKQRWATERDLAGFVSMLPRGLERSETFARVQADADRVTSSMAGFTGHGFDVAYVAGQIHAFERDIAILDSQLVPEAQTREIERIAKELRADIVQDLAVAKAVRRDLGRA